MLMRSGNETCNQDDSKSSPGQLAAGIKTALTLIFIQVLFGGMNVADLVYLLKIIQIYSFNLQNEVCSLE